MSAEVGRIEFLSGAYGVPCFDFIGEDGRKQKVSAIIVPIHIVKKGLFEMEITWGCNMSLSCKNKACRYSKASRNNP